MPIIKNFQYSTATSGTLVVNDTTDDITLIHEAATLVLSLTITFPSNPVDAQIVRILSANGITTLALNTPVGTIVGLLTTLLAGNSGSYLWYAAKSKWYKMG